MWLYWVTWLVGTWVSEPCDTYSSIREYGVSSPLLCFALHGKVINKKRIRAFENRKEAIKFIENAPMCFYGLNTVKDFELDSLWTEP